MALPSGFFLGGMAEGQQLAADQGLRQQALDQAMNVQVDKTIELNKSHIVDIIKDAKKAGVPADKIRSSLVDPIIQSVMPIFQKTGRDPTPFLSELDAHLGIPVAPAVNAAKTEIGKLRTDLKNGLITQDEFTARVDRLTKETNVPNAVESIRRKIATGQQLTPGEKQVYDDALKADPIARILAGALGTGTTTTAPTTPAGPLPQLPTDPLGLRKR